MKATIYYVDENKTDRFERDDARMGKLLPADKFRKVTEIQLPACFEPRTDGPDWRLSLCETLFERFNIGDRGGLRVRSMCVGDVIVIEGQPGLFFCDIAGFKPIEGNPQMHEFNFEATS